MRKGYLGLDVGSISTKGVVIDEDNRIIAEKYIWTEGSPIKAVKALLRALKEQGGDFTAAASGVTGSARKLVGAMLQADVIKNEITAHAVGTLAVFPQARTIFEIGGQDSKLILLENGLVTDYAMNTLCAAGTGAFLSSQAKRLGFGMEEFAELSLNSRNPSKIAARCTVFAESDMVHKAQTGHKQEDIAAGLCMAVVTNFLNNLAKGKNIRAPIVFQGGVSKNAGVVRAFEQATKERILVAPNSHLMGALGAAILGRKGQSGRAFGFGAAEMDFETRGAECDKCANNCEIVRFYRDEELIDAWGNRCEKGLLH
ncbi:MAG: acyl-CoA dehydratase activase [Clostridiales bacterium]|nr:acyl-CoA dehydratase activase [Clostridiales bacterium]